MQSVGEHIRCVEGTIINKRYRVVSECGTGNFARVFKCVDITTNLHVAVKFLKREYARDAAFEVDVLKAVTRHDPQTKERVMHLLDHFTWNRYPSFVFPLKGNTLKSRRYGVTNGAVTGGFSREEFATLATDMINAISFLHGTVRMVHTDLKPENILLETNSPSSGSSGAFYVADFGSASFYTGRLEQDLISTRPYRCPEVVIGIGWSYPADIWSLGCILFEVYTGQSFIPHAVHTDHDQLVCMQQRLGLDIPTSMVSRCKQNRLFDFQGKLLPSPFRKEVLRPMREMIPRTEDSLFDLLQHMLVLDPNQRIRAEHLVEHPFFVASSKSPSSRSSSVGGVPLPQQTPLMTPPTTTAAPISARVNKPSVATPTFDRPYPLSSRVQVAPHPLAAIQQHYIRKGLQPPHLAAAPAAVPQLPQQGFVSAQAPRQCAAPRRDSLGMYGISR